MGTAKPKAYSYIRFSTDKQMLGDSLRRQLSMARQWAIERGLELDEQTYRDLGVSGYDRSNETAALGAFLLAAESGMVAPGSYLLVENLDRLSRAGVIPTIDIIQKMVNADISVVLLSDNGRVIDKESINDTTSIMMAVIYAARAHDESRQKSRRIRAARKERRQSLYDNPGTTIMTSVCPSWLVVNADKSGFDIVPDKVKSVRKVFELTVQGMGNVVISRIANNEGWPVPGYAETWHQSLVSKIIKNRAVMGEYQPFEEQNGSRVPVGEPIPDYYPRVIEEEVFLRAQAAKARKESLPKRRDNAYRNLFFGVLKCSCGATYTRKNKGGKKQGNYHIWMCADRIRGVTKCTSWSGLDEYRLDVCLLQAMAQYRFGQIAAKKKAKELQDRIQALEVTQEETAKQIDRLVDVLAEVDNSPTLINRLRELEKRREEQEMDLKALSHELRDVSRASTDDDRFGIVEEMLYHLDRDDAESFEYRSALAQRIRAAVDVIYVFEKESMAAIIWRGGEDVKECQWVALRPNSDLNAVVEGHLKLPVK